MHSATMVSLENSRTLPSLVMCAPCRLAGDQTLSKNCAHGMMRRGESEQIRDRGQQRNAIRGERSGVKLTFSPERACGNLVAQDCNRRGPEREAHVISVCRGHGR